MLDASCCSCLTAVAADIVASSLCVGLVMLLGGSGGGDGDGGDRVMAIERLVLRTVTSNRSCCPIVLWSRVF